MTTKENVRCAQRTTKNFGVTRERRSGSPRFHLRFSRGEGRLLLSRLFRGPWFTLFDLEIDLGVLPYPLNVTGGASVFRDYSSTAAALRGEIPMVAVTQWLRNHGMSLSGFRAVKNGVVATFAADHADVAVRMRCFGSGADLFLLLDRAEVSARSEADAPIFRLLRTAFERLGFEYESGRGLFVLSDPFRDVIASTMLPMGYRLPSSASLLVLAPQVRRSSLCFFAGPRYAGPLTDERLAEVLQLTDEAALRSGELRRLLDVAQSGMYLQSYQKEEGGSVAEEISQDSSQLLDPRQPPVPPQRSSPDPSSSPIACEPDRESNSGPSDVGRAMEEVTNDFDSHDRSDRMSWEHSLRGDAIDVAFSLAQAGVHARDAARLRAALRVAIEASEFGCAREVVHVALGLVGDGPARQHWLEQLRALDLLDMGDSRRDQ